MTPTATAVPPDRISLSPSSILENHPANAVVGVLEAYSGSQPLAASFAITGGTNAADFSISQNSLQAAKALTVAGGATRQVTVTATAAQGASFSQTLTVSVLANAQAPGAPVSLEALAGPVAASGATATLSWGAAASNGAPLTFYRVQAQKDGEADWSDGPDVGTALTASFSGLLANTLYRFRVAANNSAGQGPFATTSLTTRNGDISFTLQPADMTSSDGTATFSALAVASTNGAVSYQWQRLQSDNTWANVQGATSATLSLTGLINSSNGARYRVKASAQACDDAFSNTVVLTVQRLLWYRTVSPVSGALDADSDGTRAMVLLPNGVFTTVDGTTFVRGVTPEAAPAGGWVIGAPGKGFLVHVTSLPRRKPQYGYR